METEDRTQPSGEEPQEDHEAPSHAMGDLFMALALIAICLWAATEALAMPQRGELGMITSPGFTPLLVCTILTVLSAAVAVTALKAGALGETAGRLTHMARSRQTRRVLVLSAMMVGYVLLIGVLEFTVATALYLLATFLYVRAGGWLTIAAATAIGALLTGSAIPFLFSMPTP